MAHKAKDGKEFTNASQMRQHDARNAEKAPAPHAQRGEAASEMGEEEGRAPQEVVDAHGPAHEITITHPKEGKGKHTVSSKHPDGHQHESEHETPEEAHQAGATLGGVEPEPEPAMASSAGAPAQGIPGLS